ncbi:MAG TPA: hypothetical protein VMD76_14755, partial [Candidatus Sulfotelmatobacter sp.]|nr:hypothetical protein [Candidatus Sulfotelmatobacter sp.]
MRLRSNTAAILLLLSSPILAAAQGNPVPSTPVKTIAERLGYPRDAKLLIIHADDLAVAHSEDAASFDAL